MKKHLSKLERNQDRPSAYLDLIERNRLAEQRRIADQRLAEARRFDSEDIRSYRQWVAQLDAIRAAEYHS